jgi:hypothetical protein
MPEALGMPHAVRRRIGAVLLVAGSLNINQTTGKSVEFSQLPDDNRKIEHDVGRVAALQAAGGEIHGNKPKELPHRRFTDYNADGIPAKVYCRSKDQWKSIDVNNAELGRSMAEAQGWVDQQWKDLLELWACESSWNEKVDGGIPQAKPADKMASEGNDWQTNPTTQIAWGIEYIKDRPGYGFPSKALAHFHRHNWY